MSHVRRRAMAIAFLVVLSLLTVACPEKRQNYPESTADATPVDPAPVTPGETTTPAAADTQPAAPAILRVTSNPPGATVYIGAQIEGQTLDASTGVPAGQTPCDIPLIDGYVNAGGGISIMLRKPGYRDVIGGISDGRKKIAAGGTYEFTATLNPL